MSTDRFSRYRLLLAAPIFFAAIGTANAHLPSYEGERVRHDNHFTENGFAWPVRGECDVTAVGPTDPNAGSANIFLGPGNVPPNFFCLFTSQDDWSFEFPLDIIESTRTPAPDSRDLGLELEEGYIPCSPGNPNPFQCPRNIRNPLDGSIISLPGECIDIGQPDDPAAADGPDGQYHCALLPGSPRPRTSSALFSTLAGPKDVDWAVYKYQPAYGTQPVVGAPQVPACEETVDSFPTFAYAGPLDMVDARSGEPLFVPLKKAGKLPPEVRKSLPKDYGIRVTRPGSFEPSQFEPRIGFASGFGQNGWLLAPDSVVECIDNFEKCLADPELSKHYVHNDIFFVNADRPVDLYLLWWVDQRKRAPGGSGGDRKQQLIDVSIATGVIDQFLVGDFANIGVTGPFSANGRYIHGQCNDPRPSGKVDIVIETN